MMVSRVPAYLADQALVAEEHYKSSARKRCFERCA